MTPKLKAVLAFCRDFEDRQGMQPTYHDISSGLTMQSSEAARYSVQRLVDMGYMEQSRKGWRGFAVSTSGRAYLDRYT